MEFLEKVAELLKSKGVAYEVRALLPNVSPDLRCLLTEQLQKADNNRINEQKISTKPFIKKKSKNNYVIREFKSSWSETLKTVTIIVEVPGVSNFHREKVNCQFTENGVQLRINGLNDKSYEFIENDLSYKIVPELCRWWLKKESIRLVMYKERINNMWTSLNPQQSSQHPNTSREAINAGLFEYSHFCWKKPHAAAHGRDFLERICLLAQGTEGLNELGEVDMEAKGYASVHDFDSCSKVFKLLMRSPTPKFIVIKQQPDLGRSSTWWKFLARVVDKKCFVALYNSNSYLNAKQSNTDKKALDQFITTNTRATLVHFAGYLKAGQILALPPTVRILGVAITNAAESDAVVQHLIKADLCFLSVNVKLQMSLCDLKQLPKQPSGNCLTLSFCYVSDEDMKWVMAACKVLLGADIKWPFIRIQFSQSLLTFTGALAATAIAELTPVTTNCYLNIETNFIDEADKNLLIKPNQNILQLVLMSPPAVVAPKLWNCHYGPIQWNYYEGP